jgi:hypothetical protein
LRGRLTVGEFPWFEKCVDDFARREVEMMAVGASEQFAVESVEFESVSGAEVAVKR